MIDTSNPADNFSADGSQPSDDSSTWPTSANLVDSSTPPSPPSGTPPASSSSSAPSPSAPTNEAPDASPGANTPDNGKPILPQDSAHPDVYLPPNNSKDMHQFMLRWDAKTGSYKLIAERNPKTGQWKYYNQEAFNQANKKGSKPLPAGNNKEASTSYGVSLVTRYDAASKKSVIVGFIVNGQTYYLPDGETVDLINDVNTGGPDGASKNNTPQKPGPQDPQEIPPQADAAHPDMYVPPYDPNKPGNIPDKQFLIRWDAKTKKYVVIGEHDKITGDRPFTLEEFKEANAVSGKSTNIPSASKETVETINGVTVIKRKNSKGGMEIVGVQVNGQNYYFATKEMVQKINGTNGGKILTKIPDKPDNDHPDMYVPPTNPDETYPPAQYLLRWDPEVGGYVTIGKRTRIGPGQVTETHMFDMAEFKAANSAVEFPPKEKLPEEDKEHPDFISYDQWNGKFLIYRFDKATGKYMMIGWEEKNGKKQILDPVSAKQYNDGAQAPKPPDEMSLADLPPNQNAIDMTVPPQNSGATTLKQMRYDPRNDSWYTYGEWTKEGENWVFHGYDEEQFEKANRPEGKDMLKPKKGDYESGEPPMICHYNPETQKNEIVGMKYNDRYYYFDKKTAKDVNNNVILPFTPNNAPYPTGDVPPAGDGFMKGHMDIMTTAADGRRYIWRWDSTVNRYCCVGTVDPNSNKFHMYSVEEYRKFNTGKDAQVLPANMTLPTTPEFDPMKPEEIDRTVKFKNYHPAPPPGNYKEGDSIDAAYPIYRTTKDGKKMIIGSIVVKDGKETKIYFSDIQLGYLNPGGVAADPNSQVYKDTFQKA